MNVEIPRHTPSGWSHQTSRRAVSPKRRLRRGTGTVDTAMNTPETFAEWAYECAYHTGRLRRFSRPSRSDRKSDSGQTWVRLAVRPLNHGMGVFISVWISAALRARL